MKKNLFIALLIVCAGPGLLAQRGLIPINSQYMLNGLVINPAYAGTREVLSFLASHRSQWTGFDGAPNTETFSVHTPFSGNRMALGFLFMTQNMTTERNTEFFVDYAYHLPLSIGRLSLGLSAGADVYGLRFDEIDTKDPDPSFAENERQLLPNFGVGAFYYNNNAYLGFSVPRLLSFQDTARAKLSEMTANPKLWQMYLTGGVLLPISDNFKFKPSALVKYQLALGMQFDLNANFILFKNDLLWLGTSYRFGAHPGQDSYIVAMIDVQVNPQLKIGYSYDHYLSNVQGFNASSHEILLRYEFSFRVNTVDPKFF
jgi:type IX secretion system PorP/SprF family membrane protein